jgi:hypothetical protein
MRSTAKTVPAGTGLLLCTGCRAAPSFDISGSFFPAWMLCLVIAIALAFAARYGLVRLKIEAEAGPPALIYPCLVALFSCLLWLALFR